jgi:hypothetical protein
VRGDVDVTRSDLPNRESLILAFMTCQREWEAGDVDGAPSLLEHLVDDLVLPLLRRTADPTDEGTSPTP